MTAKDAKPSGRRRERALSAAVERLRAERADRDLRLVDLQRQLDDRTAERDELRAGLAAAPPPEPGPDATAEARAEADRIVGAAQEQAGRMLAQAERQAAQIVALAHTQADRLRGAAPRRTGPQRAAEAILRTLEANGFHRSERGYSPEQVYAFVQWADGDRTGDDRPPARFDLTSPGVQARSVHDYVGAVANMLPIGPRDEVLKELRQSRERFDPAADG